MIPSYPLSIIAFVSLIPVNPSYAFDNLFFHPSFPYPIHSITIGFLKYALPSSRCFRTLVVSEMGVKYLPAGSIF